VTDWNARIVDARAGMLELEPALVLRLLEERIRGGLPAASWSDGPRGSDSILPQLDREDRLFLNMQADYVDGLRQLTSTIPRLLRLQLAVVTVYQEKPTPQAVPCSNTGCVPTLEHPEWGFLSEADQERNRKECSRCRAWRSRNGASFPDRAHVSLRDNPQDKGAA
jgi:hypothetical protein